jgi:hypothetical protein
VLISIFTFLATYLWSSFVFFDIMGVFQLLVKESEESHENLFCFVYCAETDGLLCGDVCL